MTSRINYNTPLKSVRTIRALKFEQDDQRKAFADDPARPSDADLMNDAGIAFVWENAPGRSKVEQEKTEAASLVEIQLPPQQVLAPPTNSKVPSVEVPKSPALAPAGTEANNRSFHHLFDNSQLLPGGAPADIPAPPVRPHPATNHLFPPKPTQSRTAQSGNRPPQPRRNASAESVSQSGHHSSALLSHNGGHERSSADRTGKTRGQDVPIAKEPHHHSPLSSTLHALTSDDELPPAPLTDPNGEHLIVSLIVSSPDECGSGAAVHSGLTRGNQDYLSERLRPSLSPALGLKDFYLSGRHTLPSAVPNSSLATPANGCMPIRPSSASASEAGSHYDDGDQTDVCDAFSILNSRDPDRRYQVSMLDGEHHDSSSRHTDPRARDFIMERFLPAAKAMVTESPGSSDRRSSQESPLVSPKRKNGRSLLFSRSRFAFKDQFAEEAEEQDRVDQTDLLYKCKFPWQMGALRSAVPQITAAPDSESAEQSPSPSFGKNRYSPSPTTSVGDLKDESSLRPISDSHQDDGAWSYAESDGSATPRGDNVCSFEERGLPPKSRNKNGSAIPGRQQHRSRETDCRDINQSLGVIGESADREYESEQSGRSTNSSCRRSPGGVPKDRLKETATRGDCDMRSGPLGSTGRRSPEMAYLGSLGSLLRTTQQHRRDVGRNSEAAVQAAVADAQEPIPPSSILNHHRNGPSRAAVAMSTSVHASTHTSTTKPTYPGTGILQDESSYPKHLKLNLIRQHIVEPSGGSELSLESLKDEGWENARESLASDDNHDRPEKVLRSENNNNSNLPRSANEEGLANTSIWPLVNVQHMYAQTSSLDSKDASFSSVSDRSLRSPTNLALAIQQPLSTGRSPVSVLQPPLPKSPAESWLFKVRPPGPPSTGTNWQGPKPKRFLNNSSPADSVDVKWEVLVKSENAQVRSQITQEVQRKGAEKLDILGSNAR